jgi:hypothetical protein
VELGLREAALEALAARPEWEVLDAFELTAAAASQGLNLYEDHVHFVPLVYEQINDALLNALCDADGRWVERKVDRRRLTDRRRSFQRAVGQPFGGDR